MLFSDKFAYPTTKQSAEGENSYDTLLNTEKLSLFFKFKSIWMLITKLPFNSFSVSRHMIQLNSVRYVQTSLVYCGVKGN